VIRYYLAHVPDTAPDPGKLIAGKVTAWLPDFRPSPNQGSNIDLYEVENRALDPEGHVLAALRARAPWAGRTVLDLGCGSGYWLGGYADEAAEVIGVEPDSRLLPLATASDPRVRVLHGSAEHIPLADRSVDVVHARFAYFFPPRGDAGLAEVMRVLRPGGTLVFIGNDLRSGEFAGLVRAAEGALVPVGGDETDAWWAARGAGRTVVRSSWRFASRADFEAVLRMEFPGKIAGPWLAAHPGVLGLSYSYALYALDRPEGLLRAGERAAHMPPMRSSTSVHLQFGSPSSPTGTIAVLCHDRPGRNSK
jgi:SAM-dependent methyltransferase